MSKTGKGETKIYKELLTVTDKTLKQLNLDGNKLVTNASHPVLKFHTDGVNAA